MSSLTKNTKINNVSKRNIWFQSFIVLFIAFLFIAPLNFFFKEHVFAQDEGQLLVYPSMILHGSQLYKDFFALYNPGTYYLVALSYKIFGITVFAERIVGLSYYLLYVVSLYFLIRIRRSILVSCIALIIPILLQIGLGITATAWMGALSTSTLALALIGRSLANKNPDPVRTKLLLASSGVLISLSISFRMDFALPWIFILLFLFFKVNENKLFMLYGISVGIIPLAIVVLKSGISNVIRCELFDAIRVQKSELYRVPFGSGKYFLAVDATLVLIIGIVAFFVFNIFISVKNKKLRDPFAVIIVIFYCGIIQEAFHRVDYAHVAYVAGFILATVFVFDVGSAWLSGLLIIFLPGLFFLASPYYLQSLGLKHLESYLVRNPDGGRYLYVKTKYEQFQLNSIVTTVNLATKSGDYILIAPSNLVITPYNDTDLYHLFKNLRPSGYFLEMDNGIANTSPNLLIHGILQSKIIILTSQFESWPTNNRFIYYGSAEPNRLINSNFSKSGTWGNLSVYVNRTN